MIWAISVMATGQREPFDGSMTYYGLTMFAAGAVSAMPSPRHWWLGVISVYLGQHLYAFVAYPELREWFIFGLVVNLLYPTWLFAAAGGLATYLAGRLAGRTVD